MRRPLLLTAVSLAALLVLLPSCRNGSPETPVGAYLTFHKSLRQGNFQAAWTLLSDASRKLLEERTTQIQQTTGGALELKPALLAFANVPRPPEVSEVRIVREESERAVVEVTDGPQRREVSLVKEGGTWKIDLTESLKI